MALQDILERKETLLKLNDMTNEEKTMLLLEEICNDEFGEVIPDKNWTPCNLTCRQVRKKIEYACINIAQWKDEQAKQLLIEKTKLLSSSSAQDSVRRCTIEEIYRELFNEEIPNSNPYIK